MAGKQRVDDVIIFLLTAVRGWVYTGLVLAVYCAVCGAGGGARRGTNVLS